MTHYIICEWDDSGWEVVMDLGHVNCFSSVEEAEEAVEILNNDDWGIEGYTVVECGTNSQTCYCVEHRCDVDPAWYVREEGSEEGVYFLTVKKWEDAVDYYRRDMERRGEGPREIKLEIFRVMTTEYKDGREDAVRIVNEITTTVTLSGREEE